MFKIGRNEKCWCGSGKKYKACHERNDEEKLMKFVSEGHPIPERSLIFTPEQIEGVKKCSRASVAIMNELDKFIREGVSTEDINSVVVRITKEFGAESADLGYNGYPKSCCTSINDVVCHGIPNKNEILKDGDIINVDVTTKLNGYYSDMSRMYMIGNVSEEARNLVEKTKRCLEIGIENVKPYTPIGNIGEAINAYTDANGYSIVRDLCGHGVGLTLHGEPQVPHYRPFPNEKTPIMVPGMIFTIEPMINQGIFEVDVDQKDGWTVRTVDGKLSAQWEHTVLVTEDGCEIITI